MTLERISVLLVEDNPADARLLREAVREVEGSLIHLTHVDTLGKALARLDQERFDVVMLDLSLPDADGLQTLVRTHTRAPAVPIVVLTGLDDEDLAIRAVREGAQDYIVKGQVTSHLLVRAMRYATERKRAVEALQRSEEYYRSLIENALDIITVLDPDGRVRYGSPSFERTLGYPQSALTGANAFDLVHPEDGPRVREMLETGTRHPGATQHFEFRLRHRNGTWRVFESIGKRFEAESSVNGYVLNSRDITERKRAEEQLRQVNDTLRAVIEASPLAIYVLDPDGRVRTWNPAAEEMFGFRAHEVLNRRLAVVFAEDEHTFQRRLREAVNGHLATGVEQRARRKDGAPLDISIWNSLLKDESGAVTGIVEAVADNTERKRLEEQFRQAQKMEAVGRLAGGVAHDFNNLLTVITGYCAMLLDQLTTNDPMAADMQQILKAAERATALTRQLLAFSRRQVVQPKIVELSALVHDMQPMLRRLLGEHIELAIRTDPDPTKVRVDPGHLEQVIVNLSVNGRDAMPNGGTLTIGTRTVELQDESAQHVITLRPGEYVLLEISDNGTGMDEQTLSHLFEPFFTTKEKGRGTGLGLSTSYGIVKQNHGEILVRSAPGAGSTFTIYLPLVRGAIEAPAGREGSLASYTGSETILVAEDEDDVRTVILDMLRKQGYSVLSAPNGPAALEAAANASDDIDLLITDIVMPKMSGGELARLLRADRPRLKVLFVSGYTEGAIGRSSDLEPGTAFLHKPFTPEDLARHVRELLDQPVPAVQQS
jgi:PAS domain S-box-containing protein